MHQGSYSHDPTYAGRTCDENNWSNWPLRKQLHRFSVDNGQERTIYEHRQPRCRAVGGAAAS